MRIIAGKFKGKVLSSFDLNSTRPTSDMVREALFNILYSVQDKSFLDLFSGSIVAGHRYDMSPEDVRDFLNEH
mgnify:CR=1 FL=1